MLAAPSASPRFHVPKTLSSPGTFHRPPCPLHIYLLPLMMLQAVGEMIGVDWEALICLSEPHQDSREDVSTMPRIGVVEKTGLGKPG